MFKIYWTLPCTLKKSYPIASINQAAHCTAKRYQISNFQRINVLFIGDHSYITSSQFWDFLTPLPSYVSMFLVLRISKNWHFLTPLPPYKCWRNVWMVPCIKCWLKGWCEFQKRRDQAFSFLSCDYGRSTSVCSLYGQLSYFQKWNDIIYGTHHKLAKI